MLPKPIRRMGCIAAAAVVAATCWMTSWGLCILAGIILLLVVLGLYWFLLKRMRSRKTGALHERVLASLISRVSPGDPEVAAKVDQLRRRFKDGILTFHRAGKNLYGLPWYLLLGESGAGKTEAIRHCGITFPAGLNDKYQGIGGTVNMDWWFTNHGVLLDTAGRLVEQAQAMRDNEWKEFLSLLRRYRPRCPINGAFLAVPADMLLMKTPEEIEKKGAAIARQFDTIRQTLDVRFPVYILVTKSDKIFGFREFFSCWNQDHQVNQMLGWSNPQPWDEPFKPQCTGEYLSEVQRQLIEQRLHLLRGNQDAEADDGDRPSMEAAYAFPQSFADIVPRLAIYLQQIFAADEQWRKPLFVRGIYFTSSMQEGAAMDRDLAAFLGIPAEQLPENIWRQDKALFLRDLFLKKAFREKGLVTDATDARRLWMRRKIVVAAALLVCIPVLAGLTVHKSLQLRDAQKALITPLRNANQPRARWSVMDACDVWKPADEIEPILSDLNKLHDVTIDPNWRAFRGLARYLQDVDKADIKEVYEIVYVRTFGPVVRAAENRLAGTVPPGERDFEELKELRGVLGVEQKGIDPNGPALCKALLALEQFLALRDAVGQFDKERKAIEESNYPVDAKSCSDAFEKMKLVQERMGRYADSAGYKNDPDLIQSLTTLQETLLRYASEQEKRSQALGAYTQDAKDGFQGMMAARLGEFDKALWSNRDHCFADCNATDRIMRAQNIVDLSKRIQAEHLFPETDDPNRPIAREKARQAWQELTKKLDTETLKGLIAGERDTKASPSPCFDPKIAGLVLATWRHISGQADEGVYKDYNDLYVWYWRQQYCADCFATKTLLPTPASAEHSWGERFEWLGKDFKPERVCEELKSLQHEVDAALKEIGVSQHVSQDTWPATLGKVKESWGKLGADPLIARATLLACSDLSDKYCLDRDGLDALNLYVNALCEKSFDLLVKSAGECVEKEWEWLRQEYVSRFPMNRDASDDCTDADPNRAIRVLGYLKQCFPDQEQEPNRWASLRAKPNDLSVTTAELARMEEFLTRFGKGCSVRITTLPGRSGTATKLTITTQTDSALELPIVKVRGLRPDDPGFKPGRWTPAGWEPGGWIPVMVDGSKITSDGIHYFTAEYSRGLSGTSKRPAAPEALRSERVAGRWAFMRMLRGQPRGGDTKLAITRPRRDDEDPNKPWYIVIEAKEGNIEIPLKIEFVTANEKRIPLVFDLWREDPNVP